MTRSIGTRTIDELRRNFSESTAPANTYPAAAGKVNQVSHADAPIRTYGMVKDLPSLFAGEHKATPSNLAESVPQSQLIAEANRRGETSGGGPITELVKVASQDTQPSGLPETVSQGTILRENHERWGNLGPSENAPLVGGTRNLPVPSESDNEE